MTRLAPPTLACLLLLASTGLTATARAAPAATSWLVTTKGPTCERRAHALAEEVRFACAAIGGSCRVVDEARDAELSATLDCTGPTWRLVTHTSEGARLGEIELEGEETDRLRQAAMEVARDAAPDHVLAARALENTLQKDRVAVPPPAHERFGIALAGRLFRGHPGATGVGARMLVGVRLGPVFAVTLGGAAEMGGGNAAEGYRFGRGGAGVVVGAPFGGGTHGGALRYLGLGVEAGWSLHQRLTRTTAQPVYTPSLSDAPYAQATLFAQTSLRGLRAFAGITAILVDQGGSNAAGALDVGATFTGL